MRAHEALESLLGRRSTAEFLARCWPDDSFIVHRKVGDLPQPLRERPLRSFDELAGVYTGRVQIAGGRGDDNLQFSVTASDLSYLRRVGLTVFFGDDVSGLSPGAPEFLRALERDVGAPPGIGAIRTFCSPKGGGLGVHYDQGDTFIVQLHGTKRIWLKRNTSYPVMQYVPGRPAADEHYPEYAREGFPARAPSGGRTVTMRPGSVLFVPRGMWHRTVAGTASYSASICVDTPSIIDVVLPQLRCVLQQDARFRRPLYGGWAETSPVAQQLTGLLRDAAEALAGLNPELMLDAVGVRDAQELHFRANTPFQKVPSTRWQLKRGKKGEHVLTLTAWAGERVTQLGLSAALAGGARWLQRHNRAFIYSDYLLAVRRAPAKDAELLLRSLLACEALKWLPFPIFATQV